jgi:hypothetical protein
MGWPHEANARKYVSPGKASQIAPRKLREAETDLSNTEVVFSDLFEVKLADQTMSFHVPGSIWHSDQGKQDAAQQTRQLLLQKGVVLSMSPAGTPTDTGYAERFVGSFKLAVADRPP